MRRGSTPTNTFLVDIDLRGATVYISYEQRKRVVFEKTNDDLTIEEDKITVDLSQEETLALIPGEVCIQIRYVFPNGKADASNIITTTAERIIKDGVIPS
jgi:hypothetical protein